MSADWEARAGWYLDTRAFASVEKGVSASAFSAARDAGLRCAEDSAPVAMGADGWVHVGCAEGSHGETVAEHGSIAVVDRSGKAVVA